MFLYLFTAKLIWLQISISSSEKELKFVHAIWRHGERSPLTTIPTDVANSESTWPQGLGQLTPKGVQEQYELGQYLKKRYESILSEAYDPKEIFVRSINEDRILASAQANLAGMYPPIGDAIWNTDLIWQPIPVHTQAKETDATLWMSVPCPLASKLRNEIAKSEGVKTLNKENKDFFEFLTNKTGKSNVTVENCGKILDPLSCEHYNERKWPDWVNNTIYEKLIRIVQAFSTFYFPTPETRRLRGALLLYEIAERMKQASQNKTEKLKYYAYSASDVSLIALLSNLDVYDGSWPMYNNVVLFEMYQNEDKFLVEIYKRNGTTEADLHKLALNHCNPCTVDKFLSLAEINRPTDWWHECQQAANSSLEESHSIIDY